MPQFSLLYIIFAISLQLYYFFMKIPNFLTTTFFKKQVTHLLTFDIYNFQIIEKASLIDIYLSYWEFSYILQPIKLNVKSE